LLALVLLGGGVGLGWSLNGRKSDTLDPEIQRLIFPEVQAACNDHVYRKNMIWSLEYKKAEVQQSRCPRAKLRLGLEYEEWRTKDHLGGDIDLHPDFDVSANWIEELEKENKAPSIVDGTLEHWLSRDGKDPEPQPALLIKFSREKAKFSMTTLNAKIRLRPGDRFVKIKWRLTDFVEVDIPHKDYLLTLKTVETMALKVDLGDTDYKFELTDVLRNSGDNRIHQSFSEYRFSGVFFPFQGLYYRVYSSSSK
jgi:hypothetical protein